MILNKVAIAYATGDNRIARNLEYAQIHSILIQYKL